MVSLITIPISFKADKVRAEDNIDLSQYVDSDTLNDSNYTIHDYVSKLHATKGTVYREYYAGGYTYQFFSNTSIDDPIINIIPKQYFYTVGTQLKIGKEYGFYILTEDIRDYFYSVAMVFDISFEFDNNGKIIISVKPLFTYDYVCIKPEYKKVSLFGYQMNYEIDDYWVIPLPSNIDTNEYFFSSRFVLQDVSISGELYNEQELNRYDKGYDPYNDIGLYFTDVEYLCQVKENPPDFDVLFSTLDAVSLLVGATGPVGATISSIYSVLALLHDNISFDAEYDKYLISDPTCEIGKCSYYSRANNRDDHLAQNIDEKGPYLVKQIGFAFNTVSDIKFGVNEAAIAMFKTSHSALGSQVPNYTRFVRYIALKIYDKYECKVVATDLAISKHMIKSPVSKTLIMDEPETVSLLQQGVNYFNFYADYTSDYNIKVDSEIPVKMMINGKEVVGINNNFTIKLSSGDTANIILFGNEEPIVSNIVISPSINRTNISIDENDYYIIKADFSKVMNLKTDNENVKIEKLCIIDGNILEDYMPFGKIIPYCEISYPFVNNIYYIILKNDSNNTQCVNLTVSDPKIMELEKSITSDLTLNYTYFKFEATSDSQHIFTVTKVNDNNLKYILLDENLKRKQYDFFVYNECKFSFTKGKTYYLGVACNPKYPDNQLEKDASLEIRLSDKAYCWEISGGNYDESKKTYDRIFMPERGYTYRIKFWINDAVLRTNLMSIDDDGYNLSVTSDGVLVISEETPIGGDGIIIKALYPENNDLSYNHTLKIIPQAKTDTEIEAVNDYDLGFNFKLPKDTRSFEYKLTYNSVSKTFTRNVPVSYDPNKTLFESILSNYLSMNCSGVGYITIEITKLNIIGINNKIVEYQGNFASTQVHNLFVGGTGSNDDPYLISSIRHLDNIRKLTRKMYYMNGYVDAINGYFKLVSNISTYSSWTPINNFWGVFDGNGKTIIFNSNIQIPNTDFSSMQYYGLFGLVRFANIKNVTLNIKISGSLQNSGSTVFVGGIAGYNEKGVIENCTVSGSIEVNRKNSYVGGIVGYNSSGAKIISCYSSANIYSTGTKGNICGINYGTIQ